MSININTKTTEEKQYGNLRGLFSPIVRDDYVLFIGGIEFPQDKSSSVFSKDVLKISFEKSRDLWTLSHLFTDIKVIVGKKEFNLHKIILLKLLNVFPKLLQEKEIVIDEDPQQFQEIVELLYYRKEAFNYFNDKKITFLNKMITKDQLISKKENFKLICDIPELSDISIVTNDSKTFPCHKLLLSSYSEYFYLMLTGEYKESREKEIFIETSSEIFKRFYTFIYISDVTIPSIHFGFDLLEFSNFINSSSFEKKILKILSTMITEENAFSVLLQLKERDMNHRNLRRRCLEVLEQRMNFEDVVDMCINISRKLNETLEAKRKNEESNGSSKKQKFD